MLRTPVYVLFGHKGLLGTALFQKLCEIAPDYRVYAFDHGHIDVSNKQQVKEMLNFVKPTAVINCAGLSDVELCEKATVGAYEVNTVAPKMIAEVCAKTKSKLVHFSSGMVFRGDKLRPYNERHKPSPVNVYGRSKLEGERAIRECCPDHLIIRTGWLFGPEPPNFLTDWITSIDRRLNIAVLPDHHGSPTFVPDLVDATLELLDRDAKGVFHVANAQAATWECVADFVKSLMKAKAKVSPLGKLSMSSLPPMPKYAVLSCKKFASFTGTELRPWPAAMKQCLFQMERYRP